MCIRDRFISLRRAHGNHAYLVLGLGMHDYHNLTMQQAKRYPAFFAVVLAVIFESEGRTGKY